MRRSLWSLGSWAGACALLIACESEPRQQPGCTPGTFRACAHPCGRGVEQCLESGAAWTGCACVILDASLPLSDARTDQGRVPEEGGAGGGAGGSAGGGAGGGAGGDDAEPG